MYEHKKKLVFVLEYDDDDESEEPEDDDKNLKMMVKFSQTSPIEQKEASKFQYIILV